MSRDDIRVMAKDHRKKYGVAYMISFITSLVPVLAVTGMIYHNVDKIVLQEELDDAISYHADNSKHRITALEIDSINNKLDRGLVLSIQERIEKLLMAQCKNPEMRDLLADALRDLIKEYKDLAGSDYPVPSCVQLGALQ